MLAFFVPGHPVAQGSKRHVGNGIMVESAKTLKPWRLDVAAVAEEAHAGRPPIDTPCSVTLTFTFARPKAHYRTGRHSDELRPDAPIWHAKAPDADKLARAVLDALKIANVLRDDSRCSRLLVLKQYGPRPGVHVTLDA